MRFIVANQALCWEITLLMRSLTSSIDGGANVSGVSYVVATNGDACLVSGIALLGLDLANKLGVGDFPVALDWDLVILDGDEGAGAFDALASFGTSTNALAQVAKLVCIGSIPGGSPELASLKVVAHDFIED